jgi:superfamily II DNA or RNA helicase
MTRQEVQSNGLKLAEEYSYLVYEWATGLGKSLMAINIIEKFGGNWSIVIAETNHELNWINEFKEHKKEHLLKQVKFFCYQSLHKNLEEENYIFDELHHITSEKRLNLLQQIHLYKLKRFVGLSTTLTKTQKLLIKCMIGDYHIDKVTLSDAIDAGILPEPIVYFVGIDLDTTKRVHRFNFNKDKYAMCTESEMYKRMSDRVDWLKDKYMIERNEFDKIKWLKSANDRKKFLSQCKTKHAKVLLAGLKDKRLICFTGSIEQSEELSNGL